MLAYNQAHGRDNNNAGACQLIFNDKTSFNII